MPSTKLRQLPQAEPQPKTHVAIKAAARKPTAANLKNSSADLSATRHVSTDSGCDDDDPEPEASNPQPVRLIFKNEVLARCGNITWASLWDQIRRGRFPSPRSFGGKPAWLSHELDAHLLALPVRQYKPPNPDDESNFDNMRE